MLNLGTWTTGRGQKVFAQVSKPEQKLLRKPHLKNCYFWHLHRVENFFASQPSISRTGKHVILTWLFSVVSATVLNLVRKSAQVDLHHCQSGENPTTKDKSWCGFSSGDFLRGIDSLGTNCSLSWSRVISPLPSVCSCQGK